MSRYRFFGRETISFIVILPIALPGIITGLALQTTFQTVGIDFGLLTIIIGHATFCIVVVYNNALARLRRLAGSLEEASADLGADAWQTFRYVTFPQMRTALLAGGLLAFALSFDEVIVTHLHLGCAADAADLDLRQPLQRPRELPSSTSSRCSCIAVVDRPGLPRAEAEPRSRARASPVGEK